MNKILSAILPKKGKDGRLCNSLMPKMLERICSKAVRVDDLRSVCLMLGPYRNLTTLTSALLALHPHCQVLNHAGDRILNDPKLNFLPDCSDPKFDAFVRYAIFISGRGRRGDFGGSILHSHAFDDDSMKRSYQRRYGSRMIKDEIHCLVWKESLKISNYVKDSGINLSRCLDQYSNLKFLMPVRNPLDCATSNIATRHVRYFSGQTTLSKFEDVLDKVLQELRWFIEMHQLHPDRFFYFYEHGMDKTWLIDLTTFLHLDPETVWLADALSKLTIRAKYTHSSILLEQYKRLVDRYFAAHPQVHENLHLFAEKSGPVLS